MKIGIKRLVQVAGGALLMAVLGSAAAGCIITGQCAAACVSGVDVEGTLDVQMPGNQELTVHVCYAGADCQDGKVTLDANGEGLCTDGASCAVTANADGTRHVFVQLLLDDGTDVEEGSKVDIHIEQAADKTVLVDEQLTVSAVTDNEICGTTCHGAHLTWDK